MDIEEIRLYCLSKKAVTEGFPFGRDPLVFRVGGKIFALMNLEGESRISLKCDPERAIEIREKYPFVIPGYHLNKHQWNTVELEQGVSRNLLCDWIDHSYELIYDSLPKKVKLEIEGGEWNTSFLKINNQEDFESLALKTFRFQAEQNPVYSRFLKLLSKEPDSVETIDDIPFMPIEFFKNHRVYSGEQKEEVKFLSSGTTGLRPSIHYVASKELYEKSFRTSFEMFYGPPENYCFLALLPSYLERKNSSLIFMMDSLIRTSKFENSGFYLDDLNGMSRTLGNNETKGIPTMLLGVSYALVDLAEKHPMPLKHTIIVETGGMKGRREELSRAGLHSILSKAFSVENVHSEYGMTELLSQAWSNGKGLFRPPPWMKILIRDPYDPFSYQEDGRSGGINIIDLANWYSCSFIETKDLGRLNPGGSFEVLGRFDNSDIRGCNLLVQ